MIADPSTPPARRTGRRRRRFRPGRSAAVVLASASAVLIQTAGVPVLARAAAPAVSYTYDASGRLASVTTAAGTATYHYDAEGNLLSISSAAAGPRRGTAAHRPGAPAPVIGSAGPAAVAPGQAIQISGRGFSAAAIQDVVRVGALLARVTAASETRLTVAAPPGTGGVVGVTTPGGTARGPRVTITEPRAPAAPVPGRDTRPLRAPAGVTALSGLVEDNHGRPLPGVAVTVASIAGRGQAAATTGAGGRFLITHLAPGRHQLVISGDGVNGRQYGVYAEPVELPRGATTVLPWVTYLTPLDPAHAVTLASPTTHQVTLTTPRIPGLEIQIPRGTVIRDRNGRVVRRLSVTPLTVGRTAYPLAPGMQPGFFTLQPGDARVTGPGLRVIYPNGTGQPPGTAIPFFTDTPTWPGTGWWRYGTGHVSANGSQIVPEPGARWHDTDPGGYGTAPPPPNGPPPCGDRSPGGGGPPPSGGGLGDGNNGPPPGGPASCPLGGGGGDPISLATGLFVDQNTDLSLHDILPVTMTRTFRQLDNTVRDFGIGATSSFDFYVVADRAGNFDLYNPAGAPITYAPSGTVGRYQAVGSPTRFAGSTLTWTSGDADGPFTITLTDGTVLSFSNPAYLTQITDRYGSSITINRNEFTFGGGQINTVTSTDGLWMKFTYGNCVASSPSTTCITQIQDNSGRTVSYGYDASGRLTSVTDPAGGLTSYTWAPCTSAITCTEMLSVTDPDGHVTTNTYDPSTGRITGQRDGAGNAWSYTYLTNGQGQITQAGVTDPRGTTDTYSFGPSGQLSSVTYAAGTAAAQTTTATFDPTTQLLTSETDPLGRTTAYTYDALGNVTSVTSLAGTASAATYTLTYDPKYSRVTSITDPLGHTTTISYDDTAQTETITDPAGGRSVVTLNNEGQPIQETNPQGQSTYLSYLYGDLVAVTNPLGEAAGAYFDAAGQILQITDPQGNTLSQTWTPLGELASQTTPLGAVTRYGYDPDGNLTSVTDANGHTTTFAYNGGNQVIKRTDPLGHVTAYAYDGDRNLSSITDAAGNRDTFSYDRLNNLATARYGVSGTSAQTTIGYTYDRANRMTKAVQTPGGTYAFRYDGRGDVLSEATPQGTVAHAYDAMRLPVSMSVPGQATVTYGYDKDDRLVRITQGAATVALGYDGASRPTTVVLPDGVKQTDTYDAASDLTAQTFTHGTTTVGSIGYSYTADGQVSSESGSLAGASLPAAVTGNTYNAGNQLTSSDGTAYSYNNDGDLTSNGTDTYTWNAQNQLTAISGAATASYTYNPFGQQATATVGGTSTAYLYDGTAWHANVVQEQSGGTPTANLLTGAPGQVFQLTTPAGVNSSLLTGPLGSTLALASAAGAITTSYSYTPGGAVTATGASSPNTFEFNATQNTGTGLYPMGARYYDPATGTFISPDPTGLAGGSTNLYGYAQNDPVNHSDPTGCKAKSAACYWRIFALTLDFAAIAGLTGFLVGGVAGILVGAVIGAIGAVVVAYYTDTAPECQ